jgi:hypothetical protein
METLLISRAVMLAPAQVPWDNVPHRRHSVNVTHPAQLFQSVSDSPPPTPTPTLVLDRVLALLAPLVRLLLRHGVTYPVLAASLKRVFLAEAQRELQQRGMASTDSAVSLLSGVHRRDVRTLTRGAAAEPHSAPPPTLGLAAQVVARWLHDPAFRRADGALRVLPRGGEAAGSAPGFDALVEGLSRDVRPRAVLDELLRLGVVEEGPEGLVLSRSGFAPAAGFEETLWLSAQNLLDHAAAAVANLAGPPQGSKASFLEQAVFVDEITAESAHRLHHVSVEAWRRAFEIVMAEAQQRFDADAATARPEERRHRARFGVYFYSEREPE